MNRVFLNPGTIINGSRNYIIDSVLGNGATCIVYDAHYIDNKNYSHNIRLKECYPFGIEIKRIDNGLIWNDDEERLNSVSAFSNSYHKLMVNQNGNFTVSAYDIFEANNTMYIVMDSNEGTTFDKCNLSLVEILKSVKLLTHVVGEYHKNGHLHLDIKPENFLVYPRPSEHIVLFDLDSVTSIEDIKSGKVQCVPYSKNWAAPEQMQGAINKLCPATDIFSIGAVLFEKIMGRRIANADIGIFAEWDFDDNKLFEKINPKIKRLLSEIFRKTLSANIKRRYICTDELLTALDDAIIAATQKQYLISDYIISDINFVGRKDDLNKMHSLLSNDTKAVFLHGFGGVGKTELARKYAELYGKQYDCVKFCRYSNGGLKHIIDNIEINNLDAKDNNEHLKTLKSILENSKTLFIIDNFDVEDDEDLSTLLEMNCSIIFTTRNDYTQYISSEKIEVIELESLPTDALVQVFENEYGKDVSEQEKSLVEDIIEKFGNLTIIVPMIAKQIVSSHISIEEFASSIENDTFARFDEENEDIRIRKDGQSRKTNSLDYLRAMFNIAALSEEHKTTLQYLYLLRYHNVFALTTEKYRQYTGTKNLNILNDLAFKNWITIEHNTSSEQDRITVHQLIYDLVEKDFYPTYETVPGIAKYIEDCFAIIENLMNPDNAISDAEINWEVVKPITFALLMYDDIRSSESKETYSKKMGVLFGFMCVAFLEDAHKLQELLFNSPIESTYYFYTHGIMDMLHFDAVENINRWSDWLKLLESKIAEYENLHCNISNGYVEFETQDEKMQCIDYIKTDAGLEYEKAFSNQIIVVPYFVMRLYFANANGDDAEYKNTIDLIMELEDILQEASSFNNIVTPNVPNKEMLDHRLNYYLAICNSPKYDDNAEKTHNYGLNITDNYDYYTFVLYTLQYALSLATDSDVEQNYVREAEKLIVMIEEQNERFAWYGLSKEDVLSYVIPFEINLKKNKKMHWSKKANKWYDSVENALKNTDSPYAIYKLLLTFSYQNSVLNNSKITKLIGSNLVNRIYEDDRLTDVQKEEVLLDHIIRQLHTSRIGKRQLLGFAKKHLPTLQLYFECLSKAIKYIPDIDNHILTGKIFVFLNGAYTLKWFLKKEIFDYSSYIEECITLDNINHIGELLYFADKVRRSGYIKKSQQLKHKILDLVLETNISDLPEETIQMILYKVRPLAVNYKREDVVSKIDKVKNTIERKYYLNLVGKVSLAIKPYERSSIACTFVDEYIDCVALEAYNKMHNGARVESIDDMEQLLLKHIDDLMQSSQLTHGYYEAVFRRPNEYDWHRSLHPFWAREFHDTHNKEVNIGLCYLIAQYFEDIPFKNAIEEALNYLTEEESYVLSKEELQMVLDNIKKIYPKFKR